MRAKSWAIIWVAATAMTVSATNPAAVSPDSYRDQLTRTASNAVIVSAATPSTRSTPTTTSNDAPPQPRLESPQIERPAICKIGDLPGPIVVTAIGLLACVAGPVSYYVDHAVGHGVAITVHILADFLVGLMWATRHHRCRCSGHRI
jgi:hypothetical protein